jgi:hypothetical protein
MDETCPECGATFPSTAAREAHARGTHLAGPLETRPTAAVEAREPGGDCPLCGRRYPSKESLVIHSLRPHFRSNRSLRRSPDYQLG